MKLIVKYILVILIAGGCALTPRAKLRKRILECTHDFADKGSRVKESYEVCKDAHTELGRE